MSESLAGKQVNVAMMTAGGLAPCLSASIAQLIHHWVAAYKAKEISGLTIRFYNAGYKGLLTGDSFVLDEADWDACDALNFLGGSPIGNSRVKLTNEKDCIKRGYCKDGESPSEVAAQQLLKDNVSVLHTIGGDDTNTQAAHLSQYILEKHGGKVIVVGMPKTIDNDVYPIKQTFGAKTAACEGAKFFANVVNESTANPRMLVLHEVMGRDSGYLTSATAFEYRQFLKQQKFPATSSFPFCSRAVRDVHAIWIPELNFDLPAEGARLKKVMDEYGCVNVFFGEGTGVKEIVKDMEANGEEVPRDAFGHVSLAKINPGAYFSTHLAKLVAAEKTIVQKSGYFARSAAANEFDRDLIDRCAKEGVKSAIAGVSGCMGEDEDMENTPIRALEFERVKGGKPFDVAQPWFQEMLKEIGQA
ncbi:Pyrophosphate--fructose 6-phosphate 1-phosphotransferase [Seminavis robusta]|uniref:Pyrophosphate--fructose 6-phosphate 1-phosphotransferase n=1 Tax=Seminavis robusta TaxID=568900 RepID=A0A9N8DL91_9STRA|nr:Pyrophosphate--fructose 6-phosphate 1-phosphotransferase [Seminavis robusta]|eukprot:Sro143_g066700.1 Pyrophosphate--fructose 6-phosphate 1-phosphotransferase (416) ;mRNA; r:73257-74779